MFWSSRPTGSSAPQRVADQTYLAKMKDEREPGGSRSIDALQPHLAPPAGKGAWTEHLLVAVQRRAPDPFQRHGRSLQRAESSGPLIDKHVDACSDSKCSSAKRHHLLVEEKTTVGSRSRSALRGWRHGPSHGQVHPAEGRVRRWAPVPQARGSRLDRIRNASDSPLERIVDPPPGTTHPRPPGLRDATVGLEEKAAHQTPERDVAGTPVRDVLTKIPPRERLSEVRYSGGLAHVDRLTRVPIDPLRPAPDDLRISPLSKRLRLAAIT